MRRAALLPALCASVALAQQGYAPHKMLQATYPVYVDGRVDPTLAGPLSGVISDVQAAITAWNAVPGSYARWSYAGQARPGNPAGMATPADTADRFSVAALFVTSNLDPYYALALGGGAQKSGSIPLTYAGQLYACDIFLNAVDVAWAAGTMPLTATSGSVQSFVGHELGHCMSLTESYADTLALMWYEMPLGERRVPLQADFDILQPRYPNNGNSVGSPCDGQQGAPNNVCGGALACATPAGNDPWGMPWRKMCTQPCTPGNPGACPLPYACVTSIIFAPTYSHACLPNTGNDLTQVGRPCGAAAECGSPLAICNTQDVLPSGGPLWSGGYCTQNCASPGGNPCPNGSECLQVSAGVHRCLKSCRVGYGDCRAGYACAALPGVRDGVCISACQGDVDCNGPAPFCRTCDGLCFNQNKPTGVVGDPCTTSADCGAAQVCYTSFPWAPGRGVCTQPCGTVCSACPNGSSCVAMPYTGGSQLCLRDCVPGTCASGQQCLTIGGSRGCTPACTVTSCPPGQSCVLGQCTPDGADAGSCALCYAGGGGPGGGGGPDGGIVGPPDTGGCGCQSAGATLAAILFALAFLAGPFARRAWPRR